MKDKTIRIGNAGQWIQSNIEIGGYYNSYDKPYPDDTQAFSVEKKLEMLRKIVNDLLKLKDG